MSDAIGPVHVKERPSSEMQSRIDAEVCLSNIGHWFAVVVLIMISFQVIDLICSIGSAGGETP